MSKRKSREDAIVVGAGPTGLMLAIELCLSGVRPLVLEREPRLRHVAKAGGLVGRIVELLRYRGLLHRLEVAVNEPSSPLRLPFGGLHVAVPPMELVRLPQAQIEALLADIAGELGAEIRRGHEVVGLSQDDAAVTADVRGPDGQYEVAAQYLIGCDGARSRVRELAGIPFLGTTYPEVNRLAQVSIPESVRVLENGDIEVAGIGRIGFGFKQTAGGLFALGSTDRAVMGLFTSEEESIEYDDDEPMTLTELRDSVRRVLGVDLPMGEPIRLTRFPFHARQAERYRDGRVLLAGDAAHLFPAGGVALNVGMVDSVNLGWKLAGALQGWAAAGLLDTYSDERRLAADRTMLHTRAQVALRRGHDPAAEALREVFAELLLDEQPQRRIGDFIAGNDVRYAPAGSGQHPLTGTFAPNLRLRTGQTTTSLAELMHTARPVLLDLADRPDLRAIAQEWARRVDIHTAETDQRPADALLIRPDAHIAWVAAVDESTETAAPALREALAVWFGTP